LPKDGQTLVVGLAVVGLLFAGPCLLQALLFYAGKLLGVELFR
jgi:hypothetical protein